MRYSEGRLQEFIGAHPHLIEAELYRAEKIAEAPWPGRLRPDFYFPATHLIVELKAELLGPAHLAQLKRYLEKPPAALRETALRGVLVGPRSDDIEVLLSTIAQEQLPIRLMLWEEDVPLPGMCRYCEECGAASAAQTIRFCPYCKRRGRLRNA